MSVNKSPTKIDEEKKCRRCPSTKRPTKIIGFNGYFTKKRLDTDYGFTEGGRQALADIAKKSTELIADAIRSSLLKRKFATTGDIEIVSEAVFGKEMFKRIKVKESVIGDLDDIIKERKKLTAKRKDANVQQKREITKSMKEEMKKINNICSLPISKSKIINLFKNRVGKYNGIRETAGYYLARIINNLMFVIFGLASEQARREKAIRITPRYIAKGALSVKALESFVVKNLSDVIPVDGFIDPNPLKQRINLENKRQDKIRIIKNYVKDSGSNADKMSIKRDTDKILLHKADKKRSRKFSRLQNYYKYAEWYGEDASKKIRYGNKMSKADRKANREMLKEKYDYGSTDLARKFKKMKISDLRTKYLSDMEKEKKDELKIYRRDTAEKNLKPKKSKSSATTKRARGRRAKDLFGESITEYDDLFSN